MRSNPNVIAYSTEVSEIFNKRPNQLILICSALLFAIILIFVLPLTILHFGKYEQLDVTITTHPFYRGSLLSGHSVNPNALTLETQLGKHKRSLNDKSVIYFYNPFPEALKSANNMPLTLNRKSDPYKEYGNITLLGVFFLPQNVFPKPLPHNIKMSFLEKPFDKLNEISVDFIGTKKSKNGLIISFKARIAGNKQLDLKEFYLRNFKTPVIIRLGDETFLEYIFHSSH